MRAVSSVIANGRPAAFKNWMTSVGEDEEQQCPNAEEDHLDRSSERSARIGQRSVRQARVVGSWNAYSNVAAASTIAAFPPQTQAAVRDLGVVAAAQAAQWVQRNQNPRRSSGWLTVRNQAS
jgi:hypothetical protein